jgi:hypothetical protein
MASVRWDALWEIIRVVRKSEKGKRDSTAPASGGQARDDGARKAGDALKARSCIG